MMMKANSVSRPLFGKRWGSEQIIYSKGYRNFIAFFDLGRFQTLFKVSEMTLNSIYRIANS